jgi:hypothetical protein
MVNYSAPSFHLDGNVSALWVQFAEFLYKFKYFFCPQKQRNTVSFAHFLSIQVRGHSTFLLLFPFLAEMVDNACHERLARVRLHDKGSFAIEAILKK